MLCMHAHKHTHTHTHRMSEARRPHGRFEYQNTTIFENIIQKILLKESHSFWILGVIEKRGTQIVHSSSVDVLVSSGSRCGRIFNFCFYFWNRTASVNSALQQERRAARGAGVRPVTHKWVERGAASPIIMQSAVCWCVALGAVVLTHVSCFAWRDVCVL